MASKRPAWVQEELTRRVQRADCSRHCLEEATPTARDKGSAHLLQVDGSNQQDEMAFVVQLKACALQKDLRRGSKLHYHLHEKGLLKNNIFIGNTLVHMYAKCGALTQAKDVFDKLPVKTVVSWTALIAGYAQLGQGEEALSLFDQMKEEGPFPDGVTLASILKACGSARAVQEGEKVHALIIREAFLEKVSVLGGALVDMYTKCGALGKGQNVFNDLPCQNLVSWTVLIGGYNEQGHYEEALQSFERMKHEGISPDPMVFACVLKACASSGAAKIGKEIHYEIARKGLLKNDSILGNALVDMYAKNGAIAKARHVFDELSCRNVVSWNALITGYCQQGLGERALDCFDKMKHDRVSPDAITYACALKACGNISAVEKGEEIHTEIVREGLFRKTKLGSALVDMYAKCGALTKAREVFYMLPVRDLISWTALIAGYSEQGHGEEALNCFEEMQDEGLSPDAVTFSCILKACSSIGAAETGQLYFEALSSRYGIIPTLQHHTCIVGLLGRTGYIDKAFSLLKKMPSSDCPMAWFVLLHSCQKWGNLEVEGLPAHNMAV
ncbi:hypothetical protein GOP47_0016093 [Adiantum capillus-veneris]|uniref:Pentatricopeptide repeat-containing protein n=1 Tax=Adiantum capillus-veneris TaxID=13818 RepID=A0A9D4ULQ0_ADICA|nr:hypothetical protein GOP47_0016093 [Adiantum capillus-veneris]